MGIGLSKESVNKTRHILWCDTEGGVRGVPLWDVCFIHETQDGVRAQRFAFPKHATKRGKAQLRRELPFNVVIDSNKTGSTCAIEYAFKNQTFEPISYTNIGLPLPAVVKAYLESMAGSALIAWNLRGHDKHVLTRAVGDKVMQNLVLWDALPWFRTKYMLPKYTLASNKAGTPRNIFSVPIYGSAHSSLADAAHMRDVVLRASYCWNGKDKTDVNAYLCSTRLEQLSFVHNEIENTASDQDWSQVACGAWTAGMIPPAVYKQQK